MSDKKLLFALLGIFILFVASIVLYASLTGAPLVDFSQIFNDTDSASSISRN